MPANFSNVGHTSLRCGSAPGADLNQFSTALGLLQTGLGRESRSILEFRGDMLALDMRSSCRPSVARGKSWNLWRGHWRVASRRLKSPSWMAAHRLLKPDTLWVLGKR